MPSDLFKTSSGSDVPHAAEAVCLNRPPSRQRYGINLSVHAAAVPGLVTELLEAGERVFREPAGVAGTMESPLLVRDSLTGRMKTGVSGI